MHYSFAIDISGMLPNQDSIVGLAAFPLVEKERILKNFRRRYSKILNKKGVKLKREELYRILSFLEENNVKMIAIKCTRNKWNIRYSNLPKSASYKRERLFGILYFLALKKLSEKARIYDVVICKDSFMRTEKAILACKKLAKYYAFTYNFSITTANQNLSVKIADYIAAAGRKFKEKTIEDFSNFDLQSTDIPYCYIRYVFNLY